jgi:chemotaxis signal transduction protein
MRQQRTLPRRGAREDVILFSVGGFRFGIAAGAVSEIRSMAGLQGFSPPAAYRMLDKVDHTLERNEVTYFVVNAALHFHLPPTQPLRVLVLRHAPAAVLVDSTDRMTEISVLHALPLAFNQEERNWYRGLAVLNGEAVPVVNSAAFLSKAELAILRSAVEEKQGAVVG